jgi:hypothetical protein
VSPPRGLALALAAATVFALGPAASAAGAPEPPPGLGIRQLDVPASGAEDGRSSRYVTDHVQPGAAITRRLELGNGTAEPLTVQLYAADADVDEGWVVADGRGTGELASWISVHPHELTLAPGERTTATFRIEVPPTATVGERYAAIVAEAPPIGGSVTVIPRVGVRVYLSVGGPVEPPTDFVIEELVPGRDDATGAPIVHIGVDNSGGRALDLVGELELLDGPGGVRAGPFPVAAQTTVGPERLGSVVVVLDPALPDGPWRAVATLRSGDVERQGEAIIEFPSVGMGDPESAAPVTGRSPLVAVFLGLLLLSLLLALVVWRRRAADGRDDDGDQLPPAPAVPEPSSA